MKVIRAIIFFVHIFVVLMLLGTMLNNYIPPKIFAGFNLLSLAFPILIIVHFLLIVFWIISWKKRAFAFLFLTLLMLNPIKRWVNFSSKSKEEANLKLLSFNVKGGVMGVDQVMEYLKSQDADVVLLQESNLGDQKILKQSGYHHYQISPIVEMYTKHKVVGNKQLIASSLDVNSYSDYHDIKINDQTYRFINVYLQPFQFEKSMVKLNGNSEQDEQKVKNILRRLIPTFKDHQDQVKLIRKGIDDSPYPIFLMGDFNAVPSSYEYYNLGNGLKDVFTEVGNGSATSFHDYKFPLRIDYVFTSKEIEPISYTIDRDVKLSDHFPVITEFKIKR